jgi:superfamily II DNA or RNA helicase
MSKYPDIDDSNFQEKIGKIYHKFKLEKTNKSFKNICFPNKFTYQLPQLFVSQFINPNTPYKGLLVYHKIGAGKTCAAIQIAEQWKHKKNIIFSCPASLTSNFYKELRSDCTGNEYVSQKEKDILSTLNPESREYEKLIENINSRIDKHYEILSYNKLVDYIKNGELTTRDLKNSIMIIDEVQNIVSEHGSNYKIIKEFIDKAPDNFRIILLSATPIFDKPIELALTINLLKPQNELPIGNEFNETFLDVKISKKNIVKYDIKNENLLKKYLSGYISYYQGAPEYVFPERREKIIKCPMSEYQYSCYKTVDNASGGPGSGDVSDIFKLPKNFLLGLRMISNIAFPNKLANEQGFKALTKKNMDLENLEIYSSKLAKLIHKLITNSGLNFVYSNFREYGGIKTIVKILEHHGYKNFLEHGIGKKRYAIWSGDENIEEKELIRTVFNSEDNFNGSKIKIILGSPAIKEGVSLLRVRYVHVLEPYWNMSRYEQVIGRAIRFCSHKDVPEDKRYVKVYLYLAMLPDYVNENKEIKKYSVDEHIYKLAQMKKFITDKFEDIIKKSAIDYYLFQNK